MHLERIEKPEKAILGTGNRPVWLGLPPGNSRPALPKDVSKPGLRDIQHRPEEANLLAAERMRQTNYVQGNDLMKLIGLLDRDAGAIWCILYVEPFRRYT